jgi:preprotein translocase subunit SecE
MNVLTYLKEVKAELTKVSWPTREEAIKLTAIILISSLFVGLYVGGLDVLFTNLLGLFLK